MGFGYLLIGYLITFVLYMTVNGLGFGGLALLLGYGMMFYALQELCRYHRSFAYAKWILLPCFPLAGYDLFGSLDELLLWRLPIFSATVTNVTDWITFLLLIAFNLAMLFGIRMIATEVGLGHMATASIRNSFFVGLYAVLYLFVKLPLAGLDGVRAYFGMALMLCNLMWVFFNLLLLLACNKNICRVGDEDQPAKPSRFGWVNRIGDAYERNRQRSIENTTREAEAVLRRRQERRESKKRKKK